MIPKIQNVLYATDLSKNSAYAFRYAVNTARKHDAKIHILHVIESLSPQAEALMLIQQGLGKGATYDNTLVMGLDGPIKTTLRYPDEPVRSLQLVDESFDIRIAALDGKRK